MEQKKIKRELVGEEMIGIPRAPYKDGAKWRTMEKGVNKARCYERGVTILTL